MHRRVKQRSRELSLACLIFKHQLICNQEGKLFSYMSWEKKTEFLHVVRDFSYVLLSVKA